MKRHVEVIWTRGKEGNVQHLAENDVTPEEGAGRAHRAYHQPEQRPADGLWLYQRRTPSGSRV